MRIRSLKSRDYTATVSIRPIQDVSLAVVVALRSAEGSGISEEWACSMSG